MYVGSRRLAGGLFLATVATGVITINVLPLSKPAWASGLFFGWPFAGGSQYPSTLPLTGNEGVAADTQLQQGLNPASELISVDNLLQGTATTDTTATSHTVTATLMSGGAQITLLMTGAPSSGVTATTATAAQLVANVPGATVGKKWLLKIVNVGGTSSGVWTVAGGTNVTITGNTSVAVAGSREYLATITSTSTPAVTLQDFGN